MSCTKVLKNGSGRVDLRIHLKFFVRENHMNIGILAQN